MLLRLSSHVLLWFTGMFVLLVTVAHQPFDGSELRAFLIPPDTCGSPCFMGIQLGETGSERAMGILEDHAWVDEVFVIMNGFYGEWSWSGEQPRFVNTRSRGFLGAHSAQYNVYYSMSIDSTITLGELYLALGTPDLSFFTHTERARSRTLVHSVYYNALGLQADGAISCPATLGRLWQSDLTLYWGSLPGRERVQMQMPYTFPHYPRAWLNDLSLC
jgi:hypothetical protein